MKAGDNDDDSPNTGRSMHVCKCCVQDIKGDNGAAVIHVLILQFDRFVKSSHSSEPCAASSLHFKEKHYRTNMKEQDMAVNWSVRQSIH